MFCGAATAQLPYQLLGAKAAGMGGAAVAVPDLWALQYNIGALAGVQEAKLAVGYQTRFNIPELSTAAALLSWPLPVGVGGLSISRYGFGAYSIHEGSLGFAHQIGQFSMGVQGGFVQAGTRDFGSRTVAVLSLGGTAVLLPKLYFGGYVYNIMQARLNPETDEYLPTLLRAGLRWQPSEPLQLLLETEKDVDYPARLKAGVEYMLRPFLALRTGLSTNPVNLHGGLGLKSGKFMIDYAMEHHRWIGLVHHTTVSWQLRETK